MTQLLRFGLKKKRVGLVGLRYVTCSLMEGTPLTEISNRKYLSLSQIHTQVHFNLVISLIKLMSSILCKIYIFFLLVPMEF